MRRNIIKIVLFLFVATAFIQCNEKEEKVEKEKNLEAAEYILKKEMENVPEQFSFDNCYSSIDTAAREADYLTTYFNFLGGEKEFNKAEYVKLYESTRDSKIFSTTLVFMILILIMGILSLLLSLFKNNDTKFSVGLIVIGIMVETFISCLLYTSPSPRD